MDDWAADAGVGIIGITAIGGLGKTALLGRWLRRDGESAPRHADGIFFWSYYRDTNTKSMLEELLQFGQEELDWQVPERLDGAPETEQVLDLLGRRRLIVALDGLEVVQESPGTVAYGKLMSPDLAELLHRHGRENSLDPSPVLLAPAASQVSLDEGTVTGTSRSLIMLTSRFPFPDLTVYLGASLRTLPLPELESAEGAALLAALGVHGREEDREEISRRLSGHPLALRVFARSMPAEVAGDPTRMWQQVFDTPHMAGADSLAGKMQRLLAFYEQQLPEPQRLALGLLALFRMPVGEATLAVLWAKLQPDSAGLLRGLLDGLHHEHLLTSDPASDGTPKYACHPILRDHFRGRLLGQEDFIRDAARLLSDRPDTIQPRSMASVQQVVAAIELLLEAGDVEAADDLYYRRLEGGQLLLALPAPYLGMEVARWFVRDAARRRAVRKQLSDRALSFYLNDVGLQAKLAGEPGTALKYLAESVEHDRDAEDWLNLSICLWNLSTVEVSLGLLDIALGHQSEALQKASKAEAEGEISDCRSLGAYIDSLLGEIARADGAFLEANAFELRFDPDLDGLYSMPGVWWAEHLLRCGERMQSRQLTASNLEICRQNSWNSHSGLCEWILGWLDVLDGHWDAAAAHLVAARDIFIRGHMIHELARTLVTESALWLGRGDHAAALGACERARELAAPRQYRLVHADALVQRARIWLQLFQPDAGRARDDAEAALQLAQTCGYAWAQRDASELLATAYRQLDQPDVSARYQAEADQWSRRLRRPDAGLPAAP